MGMMKKRQQQMARVDRVGPDGVNVQNSRPNYDSAKEAVRRVGEYKRGRVDKASGDTIAMNRRKQENL